MFGNNTPSILKAISESETRMLSRADKDKDQSNLRFDKLEMSIRVWKKMLSD